MCTTGNSEDIIILSDDDDDEDEKESDLSCLIVDVKDNKNLERVSSSSMQDEDVVVTFSRGADVLPHARHDCPVHTFMATESETSAPVASNQLICDQCFCYICDKPASSCTLWGHGGVCHCNSHKKSDFWKNVRYIHLVGDLAVFNLALSDIDSHLQCAATMLQNFKEQVSKLFSSYSSSRDQNRQSSTQDYTSVFEFVSTFLNKADEQNCRAAAIMHLGAAKEFLTHFQASLPVVPSLTSEVSEAKMMLLQRVIKTVQRLIVIDDLPPQFIYKLQDFYQKKLYLPVEMKSLRNSLRIRPWDDILLVSVLRGQNVTGDRKDRGKKDVLVEQISVVLLRAELLQRQRRYRELCRYLRVVQTDDDFTRFQRVQDLIPYFLCLNGDFMSALISLFSSFNAAASRLTPQLFLFYLRVFKTARAPKLMVSEPEQLCCSDAPWEPIIEALPLKCVELVRFGLRAQRFSSSVYADSLCWTSLLGIVNSSHDSSTAFPAPSPQFLHEARQHVNSLLLNQHDSNLLIPRSFLEVYPAQALLLLVTGALGFRIIYASLSPTLPVLNTFKRHILEMGMGIPSVQLPLLLTSVSEHLGTDKTGLEILDGHVVLFLFDDNLWAFKWLCENLSSNEERFNSFIQDLTQEAKNSTGIQLAVTLDSFQLTLPSQTEPENSAA